MSLRIFVRLLVTAWTIVPAVVWGQPAQAAPVCVDKPVMSERIAKAWRDQHIAPPGATDPTMFKVRSAAVYLPRDIEWVTALADWHAARGGLPEVALKP